MSALPVIHPLDEDAPRWIGPESDRVCGCNQCRHWSPLLRHIEAQLDESALALLHEYVSHIEQRVEDGDVAQSKLAGTWPGYHALKTFEPSYREDHDPIDP